MHYLRRISTRRLLALCLGVVLAAAGGTAIAIAATSGGPKPAPKPLAQALHDAATAPAVQGVSARIQFTNHLIDSSNLGEGADPLLAGASGRLWATKDRLRLELQTTGGAGDSQILVDNGRFTVYDAGAHTVYTGTLPAGRQDATSSQKQDQPPTAADIQKKLDELMKDASVSGAVPSDVAGHPAYTVRIGPKHDGGLLGGAELAWDAVRGVPLRAAIYAKGSSSPVLELKATQISFGKVDGSVFAITPPSDAKVVDLAPKQEQQGAAGSGASKPMPVEGASAVQAKLPFTLAAPSSLGGKPLSGVRLISSDRHPAALVTYGQGLGGFAVIESQAQSGAQSAQSLGDRGGLKLPSVSIGGASGNELQTALGTALTFERGGVSYVVLGSAPADAVAAAARAL